MGIIQCGSFAGNTTVNIGWEPQWIMFKRIESTGDWITIDNMRGCAVGAVDAVLNPNLANAESSANDYIDFTATGFITKNLTGTYIYTVIRRPNKPPTTGTQVYNAIARTGTGAAATVTGVGFAPDLVSVSDRTKTASAESFNLWDRLRGVQLGVRSDTTSAEFTDTAAISSFDMSGISCGSSNRTNSVVGYINHFFRRAPGFFDVVCYTGTGTPRTVSHNLETIPEFMIVKKRSSAGSFNCYASNLGPTKWILLNSDAVPVATSGVWDDTPPTNTTFIVGTSTQVNESASTYVAYLFATLPGISKVGSYTGNGSSQTINCGFSTGARFVLVKRTDSTGDWYVWSSATGIVAANDPHLSLNTTAAEVTTDDSIDPDAGGFIVNQVAATNINVNAAQYLYLAIA